MDSFPLKCPLCASSYASSSAKPSNSLSKTLITAPMSNRPNLQTCGWCPLQACVLQIAMHCVTKLSSASMCITHCNALCPQIVLCKHVQRSIPSDPPLSPFPMCTPVSPQFTESAPVPDPLLLNGGQKSNLGFFSYTTVHCDTGLKNDKVGKVTLHSIQYGLSLDSYNAGLNRRIETSILCKKRIK